MNATLLTLRRIILLPSRSSVRWALLITIVLSLMQPTPAYAASLVVNTLDDELNSDGDCSLREAIQAANDNVTMDACPAGDPVDTDTISFAVSGSISVNDQLEITGGGPLVIKGANAIEVSGIGIGGYGPRVMFVDSGAVATLEDLTIRNGYADNGAGIYTAGTLALDHVVVSGNHADYGVGSEGGGIYNDHGELMIRDSTISGNFTDGYGGGIENHGTLHVTGSILSGNFSNQEGGGIENNGELSIADSILSGNHAQSFGGGISNSGTATITNSTLSGNSAYRFGGGIKNDGSMTLTGSTVRGNLGEFAVGGILNGGTLHITNSSVDGNYADGDCGGMLNTGTTIADHSVLSGSDFCNTGTLTIADSTLPGSRIYNDAMVILSDTYSLGSGPAIVTLTDSTLSGHAANQGGNIYNAGTLKMTRSTMSGGYAYAEGGGIYNYQGTVAVQNSTLSGNSAYNLGGGIYNYQGTVAVQNSTLSGNSVGTDGRGGGIFNEGGTVTLYSSIVAYAPSGPNCDGAIIDAGYNIEDGETCSLVPANGSLTNTDPLLGPLQDNGGPTQTHALLPASPAIDAGDPLNCPATDQRGVSRPLDGDLDGMARCDMGAYEIGVVATIDITPAIIILPGKGTWITAYIELPHGSNVGAIDLSTVRLQGTIPAANQLAKVADHDKDGNPDIMVQFSQPALITQLGGVTGEVKLVVTGRLRDGTPFEGWDTIRVGPKK